VPGNDDVGRTEISFQVSDGTQRITQSFTLNTVTGNNHSNMMIYNNPTNGPFTIFVDQCENKEVEILVRMLNGNVIYKNVVKNASDRVLLPFDLTGSVKGIYLVEVKVGNVFSAKKIMLQ